MERNGTEQIYYPLVFAPTLIYGYEQCYLYSICSDAFLLPTHTFV